MTRIEQWSVGNICSVWWALAMTNRCSIRRNLDTEDRIGRRWPFTARIDNVLLRLFQISTLVSPWWSSITLSNSSSFHLRVVRSLVRSRIRYSSLPSIFHTRLDKHCGRNKIRVLFSSNVCYISILVRKAH